MERQPSSAELPLPVVIRTDQFGDEHGALSVLQQPQLPFSVRRIYLLSGVGPGERRGKHAHKQLHQAFIALTASVSVELSDSQNFHRVYQLNPLVDCLIVPPGYWRELSFASKASIALVLASHTYDENDYIRSYKEYVRWRLS